MNAQDDKAVWNAWYPVGSPVDLRRQKRTRTHLLDRELTLTLHPTRITAECDRRALPVVERLGYVWTTLGKPEKLPQPLIEYYEVDRLTLNIWSTRSNAPACGLSTTLSTTLTFHSSPREF